jgi:hypothetical protein
LGWPTLPQFRGMLLKENRKQANKVSETSGNGYKGTLSKLPNEFLWLLSGFIGIRLKLLSKLIKGCYGNTKPKWSLVY